MLCLLCIGTAVGPRAPNAWQRTATAPTTVRRAFTKPTQQTGAKPFSTDLHRAVAERIKRELQHVKAFPSREFTSGKGNNIVAATRIAQVSSFGRFKSTLLV